jgi:hypothetical protein
LEKKIGRPKKSSVLSKKKGHTGNPVGRPKGTAAIMEDYKARMLNSPQSRKVLQSIFDAALNDEHKNQAAAWKIVVDRIMPVGMFEKEVMKDVSRSQIQINITGVGSVTSEASEFIDAEVIEEDESGT